MKLRIAVLFGGRSGEHEVSIMSAQSVLAVLDPQKYTVIPVAITHEGAWLTGEQALAVLQGAAPLSNLKSALIFPSPDRPGIYTLEKGNVGEKLHLLSQVDVAFPVLHGTFGEDGTLQGLFELANIAYVGAGVLASAVGMDKGVFKDVMVAHGLPVVEWIVVTRQQVQEKMIEVLHKSELLAPYPLFTKPANLGSSVGITKCRSRADLMEGLLDAARYDRRILVERGLHAREIEVSILGNENPIASLPGEVIPSDEFYSYRAKYVDDRSELVIPAPLPENTINHIRHLAISAYQAIDCAGMARVDFFVDKDHGDVYIGEINTLPGFTRISMYPKLWQATGITYPELIDRLVALALERKGDREHTERRFGG